MSDSIYVATGTLRLGAKKHIAGSIITLSDDDAAVFAEVIRPASPEEIAVYEATQVAVEEPVKEPAVKAPVKTAAEKKAEKDAAAAAKKAEEDAAAKKAEEDAAASGGNGETLV